MMGGNRKMFLPASNYYRWRMKIGWKLKLSVEDLATLPNLEDKISKTDLLTEVLWVK